jgi:hypothetical protein
VENPNGEFNTSGIGAGALPPWRFAVLLGALSLAGCAAYQVGSQSLYAPDVATVYVPIVESDSYRRELGERLTEAVAKKIDLNTHFKVVGTPDADSVLSVRLISETRRVVVENASDDPRGLEVDMHAEVTWLNRRRLPIVPVHAILLPPDLARFHQQSVLIPEVGQSIVTAQQQAIDRLADQIVSAMEEPW